MDEDATTTALVYQEPAENKEKLERGSEIKIGQSKGQTGVKSTFVIQSHVALFLSLLVKMSFKLFPIKNRN